MTREIYNSKLVAFGDSITLGIGVPEGSKKWTEIIKERFNLQLTNSGIGGDTSSSGVLRLQTDVLNYYPDFVLICFGMNDHVMATKGKPQVSIKTFADNIIQMIIKIRNIDSVPILLTPNYIIEGDSDNYYYSRHNPDFYSDAGGAQVWLDEYIEEIRNISQEESVELIDIRKKCDENDPYVFLRSLKNDTYSDGVHPHALGAKVYADTIGTYLEAHFSTKQRG